MNSKRFFLSLCLLTTFSAVSGSLNASATHDDGEEKRGKARASSSAEKKEKDPFELYSVTLSKFSSKKTPFALSVDDLTELLKAPKTDSNEVLAQDKKNLHRIQLVCVKEVRVKDLQEGDQIIPMSDSQSMSSFESTDLPYVVMRDGKIALGFRLVINTESKKDFLNNIRSKNKMNGHLTASSKDQAKMLALQAEYYADLLPLHFKRQLRTSESLLETFDPKSVTRVPMPLLQAFLCDGIGSSGSRYTKTLLLEGGHLLTFSSQTLSRFELVDPTDLLSYLGFSLSKKKRRNGENSNLAMTFHYEIAKATYVNANKKVKSDALPTPPAPHLFDLTIKRIEETADTSRDEQSLIPMSLMVQPVRPSYERLKASSRAQLEGQVKERPRSRSFNVEDTDFDLTVMEEGEKTDRTKTSPISIIKMKEPHVHSSEDSDSGDGRGLNAHDFLMTSLQQHRKDSGRSVRPFKPRVDYKRASSVQSLSSIVSRTKSPTKVNHNGVTSPRHSPKLSTKHEEMDGVLEGLSDLTLSAQHSSSDSSGSSSPHKRSRKQSVSKKVTTSGKSGDSKNEKPKTPEDSE